MKDSDTTEPWPKDAPPLDAIPDFRLIRLVGRGSFGQVWLARNVTTQGLRAVKIIRLRESGAVDLAGREIVSLSYLEQNVRVQHANVVRIDHVGKTSKYLYYTMKPADDVSGSPGSDDEAYRPDTLSGRLQDGHLSCDDCIRCCQELLAGLASLHQQRMVHRDVKPANCIFVGGVLQLADFGLLTDANRSSCSVVGTRMYMPRDFVMDARADVYAAGLIIYEMLTGHSARNFPSLGSRSAEIAQNDRLAVLNRLTIKACEQDRDKRFANAAEMLAELDNGLASVRSLGKNGKQPRQTIRIRRRFLVVAGVAALGLAAGGVFWWGQRNPEYVDVNFITNRYDATIELDGVVLEADGIPYTTPCTVPNLAAEEHKVVFKHPDEPEDLEIGAIDFTKIREVIAHWHPEEVTDDKAPTRNDQIPMTNDP